MFDITSMLGNSNQSSGGGSVGSFSLTDYAAIKNGSYGKLVKSYYQGTVKDIETQKAAANSSKAAKTVKTKASEVDETGLSQIKKDADQLKTSAEDLAKDDLIKKTDGKLDQKAVDAVKKFADNYNKVIDQAGKISSKEVSQDVQFMKGMTDTFSKVLGKIGITVGQDGKMSVNEEALGKADTATVKSLFNGMATYGSQIADKASSIYKDADIGSTIYDSNATTQSALASVYNQFI